MRAQEWLFADVLLTLQLPFDNTRYMRNTTFSDEDSDDMEANAATIAKEEARAARLAREQDRLEEEMERKRKEEKMKRRAGK